MKSGQIGYDTKYCYPNSNVLRNKLNIKDIELHHNEERYITSNRLLALEMQPLKGDFDLKHLQGFHKYIFDPFYDWAGEIRLVDIEKGNMFCRVQFINGMADDIFRKLSRENYLIGCPKDEYVKKLAFYFGEINALHPFREGNGRVQREFMSNLASVSGYKLDYGKMDTDKFMEGMIESFDLKYEKLIETLESGLTHITYEEQFEKCKQISMRGSSFEKAFLKYQTYIKGIQRDITETGFKATDKAIKCMEKIHQKSGKDLTVKDVNNIIKGNLKIDDMKLKENCQTAAKLFGQQEALKMERMDIMERLR